MDRMNHYRELIKRGLWSRQERYNGSPPNDVEAMCVFDDARDHYLLLYVGWRDPHRVEKTMLHVRLHNGKIWIETDDTEDGFATELVKAGVPHSDIVLAFHPPQLRSMTDFAVA